MRSRKNFLKYMVLYVLSQGDMRAYQIKKSIRKMTLDTYEPSTGALYPAIRWLINNGYVVKKDGNYSITDQGKDFLKEQMMKVKNRVETETKKFRNLSEILKELHEIVKIINSFDEEFLEKRKDEIKSIIEEAKNKLGRL